MAISVMMTMTNKNHLMIFRFLAPPVRMAGFIGPRVPLKNKRMNLKTNEILLLEQLTSSVATQTVESLNRS